MIRRLAVLAALLAGCAPRPVTTTPAVAATDPEPVGADATSELVLEPPAAADAAALTDLDPAVLDARALEVELDLLRRGAWGAELSPDAGSAVLFGVGRGWVTEGGTRRLKVRADWYAAAFAPDGRHAAVVTGKNVAVIDVQRGRVIARLPIRADSRGSPETVAVRFLDDAELVYFDGCQLVRAPVGKGEAVATGPEICGRPHPSADGTRWLVWSQNDDGDVAVHRVDATTGAAETLLGGRGDPPGLSVFVASADADAFCFSRRTDRSELTCRDLSSGVELVAWQGPTDGRVAFGSGDRVVFGGGPIKRDRPLVVIDLAARTRQVLGELGAGEEWLAFLGADRIVASGGSRVLVFELAGHRRLEIDLGDGEWEGLVVPPRASSRFLLGKERRASRDLYWVTLPDE